MEWDDWNGCWLNKACDYVFGGTGCFAGAMGYGNQVLKKGDEKGFPASNIIIQITGPKRPEGV